MICAGDSAGAGDRPSIVLRAVKYRYLFTKDKWYQDNGLLPSALNIFTIHNKDSGISSEFQYYQCPPPLPLETHLVVVRGFIY